jgi:hypothetical protein
LPVWRSLQILAQQRLTREVGIDSTTARAPSPPHEPVAESSPASRV